MARVTQHRLSMCAVCALFCFHLPCATAAAAAPAIPGLVLLVVWLAALQVARMSKGHNRSNFIRPYG